jgi:hypothetical protein
MSFQLRYCMLPQAIALRWYFSNYACRNLIQSKKSLPRWVPRLSLRVIGFVRQGRRTIGSCLAPGSQFVVIDPTQASQFSRLSLPLSGSLLASVRLRRSLANILAASHAIYDGGRVGEGKRRTRQQTQDPLGLSWTALAYPLDWERNCHQHFVSSDQRYVPSRVAPTSTMRSVIARIERRRGQARILVNAARRRSP